MSRSRASALGVLLLLVVLTSGCLGVLTGSQPFVASASKATVSDNALSQTNFQHQDTQATWANRTVSVAGQQRDVRVKNYVATYQLPPSIDASGGVTFGVFTVASTPKVSIAGQAMNPIGSMSHQQLVENLAGNNLKDVKEVGTEQRTVLGSGTEVTKFSAIAQQSGHQVPVYVEVTRVEDGDDYVVAVGVYPQNSDSVPPQVKTLVQGVQH